MQVEEMELPYDGGALPVAVYWPEQGTEHPALIVATGGLEQGSVDAYRWAGQRFAAGGYATLILTYRAASPYADVDDVRLAADWLATNSRVDAARIAVLGHSRGGLGALLAAASDSHIAAAVSICAPSDLPDYMARLGGFFPAARDSIAQFLGGLPEEAPGRYAEIHLLGLSGKLLKPVLLLHGTADMRVPVDQSLSLVAALREGGNQDVQLELLPGVGHFLERGTTGYEFDRVTELTTAWLRKFLG